MIMNASTGQRFGFSFPRVAMSIPFSLAMSVAVLPFASLSAGSAPACNNASTTSTCPFSTALCRADTGGEHSQHNSDEAMNQSSYSRVPRSFRFRRSLGWTTPISCRSAPLAIKSFTFSTLPSWAAKTRALLPLNSAPWSRRS